MKIAICSQNKKNITGHAGKCRRFFIYTIENKEVKSKAVIETTPEESLHHAGLDAHAVGQVDVVITAGMGAGMQNRLANANIEAIVTDETDPETAIQLYLAGNLKTIEHTHSHRSNHSCGCGNHEHHH